MLMLHIAILRWPLMSPWCYWLEKVQRWEPGSAFHILRSLLTNELISHQAILEHLAIINIIINKPSWVLHNKQALLSNFQAWGSWPFVRTPCLSASSSLRACHLHLCPQPCWETCFSSSALCCLGLHPLPASQASLGCWEKESTKPPSGADLKAHKASPHVQGLGNHTQPCMQTVQSSRLLEKPNNTQGKPEGFLFQLVYKSTCIFETS